ncbi:MAG: hypothetical protein GF334_07870 [Candidatus Altiarchaeales archaeon]|nr:hypothetical protein [Candidatus Altiarchaeales archaeon]
MAKHYIAMVGLYGCLPNSCDVYKTKKDAIESIIFIQGTKRGYIGNLRKHGYTDMDLNEFGNEYAEIIECDCDEPHIHQDSMGEDEFYRNW